MKVRCDICSGDLDVDAANLGQTTTCPHCGKSTALYAPPAALAIRPLETSPSGDASAKRMPLLRLPLVLSARTIRLPKVSFGPVEIALCAMAGSGLLLLLSYNKWLALYTVVLTLAVAFVGKKLGNLKALLNQTNAQLSDVQEKYLAVNANTRLVMLQEWLKSLPRLQFASEREVEIKFVAPLVHHLGYPWDCVALQEKIMIYAGRETYETRADWVLRRASNRKPHVVIEAKDRSEQLTEAVRQQARSYAVGLRAQYYLTTNGVQLRLFKQSVTEEELLIDVPVEKLADKWNDLVDHIGNANI
jgi:hypothetical protein